MPEVVVKGRSLAYAIEPPVIDSAKGAVVFIHGSGGDSEDWRFQLDALSHVAATIAIDLPGHGASPLPAEEQIDLYARWVADFVEELGLQKVMIVGCSLGSAITLKIALSQPAWLRAIGLVGAGARLRVLPALLEDLEKNPQTVLAMLGDLCVSPSSSPEVREAVREKLLSARPDVVHKDLKACDGFDVMNSIKEISVPAWIIVGEDDKLTPVKYAHFLEREIPDTSFSIVPGAGHLVMIEQPQAFNNSLSQFLRNSGMLE
jgi:pimeloyl-ACP methyl ester carboxylesterase